MEDEKGGSGDASEAPVASTHQSDDEDTGGRRNWIALIFVLVLAAAAVLVANFLMKQSRIQDCVMSGRRDCVDISPTSTQ